jgi:hypothetical protein
LGKTKLDRVAMNDYPKPPFETKVTLSEDPGPGSTEGPTEFVIDLNDMDSEELRLAAASGSALAEKILAFRANSQDQKD